MLKIRTDKEIENDTVKLYNKNDEFIGNIESGLSMQDVCIQIKRDNIEGFYIQFNNEKTVINSDGRCYFNGKRPFGAMSDILRELI